MCLSEHSRKMGRCEVKGTTIALVGLGLAGAAALAKRSTTAPERIGPPPPPRVPPAPATEPDAPTIQMMRAPEPPPVEQGSWSRLVVQNVGAGRTRICQDATAWWRDRNCFAVPLQTIFSHQLDAIGGWISVRLWADTELSPVRDRSQPAASYWAWLGELQPGRKLSTIVSKAAIVGSELPAISWIQAGARISASGVLEVTWRYPGDENTGIERGRKYDAMVQWRITPNKPQ